MHCAWRLPYTWVVFTSGCIGVDTLAVTAGSSHTSCWSADVLYNIHRRRRIRVLQDVLVNTHLLRIKEDAECVHGGRSSIEIFFIKLQTIMPWIPQFSPVIVTLFAVTGVHAAVSMSFFVRYRHSFPINARKMGLVLAGVVRFMALLHFLLCVRVCVRTLPNTQAACWNISQQLNSWSLFGASSYSNHSR